MVKRIKKKEGFTAYWKRKAKYIEYLNEMKMKNCVTETKL